MVSKEYIEHELKKLDDKQTRMKYGLHKFDLDRQIDLYNALKYIELYEAFKKIDEEFNSRNSL